MIYIATVGNLRIVFKPIMEDGELVAIGEIVEAWDYAAGFHGSWLEAPVKWMVAEIAKRGLQAEILAAAEVAS